MIDTLRVKKVVKVCKSCGVEKPLVDFPARSDAGDGRRNECRECAKEKNRAYYMLNAERLKAAQREWNKNNKDRKRSYARAWYLKNPDKVRESREKWSNANPDKVQARIRRWADNNPDKVREKSRRWRLNNPEKAKEAMKKSNAKRYCIPAYRVSAAISSGIRRSLRGAKSYSHWESMVGYSVDELRRHLAGRFKKGMSWENYGAYWEIDHIIPLAAFRYVTHQDERFKKAWSLDNLQPLTKSENRRKSSKAPEVWQKTAQP